MAKNPLIFDDDSILLPSWVTQAAEQEPYIVPPEPLDVVIPGLDTRGSEVLSGETPLSELLARRAPKQRKGGRHKKVLPGEVGPCTRCGWVWYPDQRTILKRSDGLPTRCSNCRSDYWRVAPITHDARWHIKHAHEGAWERCKICQGGATPSHPKWGMNKTDIEFRRRRQHAKRLNELADEFGVRIICEENGQMVAKIPPRKIHVIPPPPGMEAEE